MEIRDIGTVAVVRDNKVLILKRSAQTNGRGFWNFPGGAVEEGESFKEGAARELEEEAGLISNPDVFEELGVLKTRDLIIHFFITDQSSGEVNINWESDDFAWISPEEFSDYLFVGGGTLHPQLLNGIIEFMKGE